MSESAHMTNTPAQAIMTMGKRLSIQPRNQRRERIDSAGTLARVADSKQKAMMAVNSDMADRFTTDSMWNVAWSIDRV